MTLMSEGELEPGRVMKIVNHPVRMRIIELLATKGPLSWKELSGDLGIRTGSLYHHIDALERIVTRDSEKKYVLTKFGREIYANISENPALASQNIEKVIKRRSPSSIIQGIFVPRSLIYVWTSTRSKAAISAVIVSALLAAALVASSEQLVLYSFSPADGVVFSAATYLGSVALVVVLAAVSLRAFFRQKSDLTILFPSVILSFLPVVLFGLLLSFLTGPESLSSLGDRSLLTVAVAFFQAWGAGILGAGMSVASGLRIEKTLMVSLVLLYATTVVVFVQGGVLA
jgi:DNA-binding MarR family transcriptional regulator